MPTSPETPPAPAVRLPRVGIYVPDDGYGALSRAQALIPQVHALVTVLTAMDVPASRFGNVLAVRVPSRRNATAAVIRAHAAGLIDWAEQEQPDLLVVEGCPDTVRLAEICAIPVVMLRRVGRCWDDVHAAAYKACRAVIAPWSSLLEDPEAPAWVRGLTTYTEGWSRFDHLHLDGDEARTSLGLPPERPVVTVMAGMDGIPGLDARRLVESATAVPQWTWVVVGRCHGVSYTDLPDNVVVVGWADDPSTHLAAADVVVCAGGYSTVMEAAALRRPVVVVPRHRPYDAERLLAERLARLHAATHVDGWPDAGSWATVLDKARSTSLAPLQALHHREGAARAAALLHQWIPPA